jgi:hypothetical protein
MFDDCSRPVVFCVVFIPPCQKKTKKNQAVEKATRQHLGVVVSVAKALASVEAQLSGHLQSSASIEVCESVLSNRIAVFEQPFLFFFVEKGLLQDAATWDVDGMLLHAAQHGPNGPRPGWLPGVSRLHWGNIMHICSVRETVAHELLSPEQPGDSDASSADEPTPHDDDDSVAAPATKTKVKSTALGSSSSPLSLRRVGTAASDAITSSPVLARKSPAEAHAATPETPKTHGGGLLQRLGRFMRSTKTPGKADDAEHGSEGKTPKKPKKKKKTVNEGGLTGASSIDGQTLAVPTYAVDADGFAVIDGGLLLILWYFFCSNPIHIPCCSAGGQRLVCSYVWPNPNGHICSRLVFKRRR